MRRTLTRLAAPLAGAFVFSAIACSAGSSEAATWDLPFAWPDGNFHVQNGKLFANEVERVTNGEVVINIHPGGSLGFKGNEMLTAVRDGLVPIGDVQLLLQVGEVPVFELPSLPFIVKDLEQMKVLLKHYQFVVDRVAKQYNQKSLYIVPWPGPWVHAKVEVNKLEDLQGIKIRTCCKTNAEIYNAIGMVAVQLPWGEVVPSLAAGTIGAVTTSTSSGVDGKFWEFLKHFYPLHDSWNLQMISVNLDAWNSLSEDNRKAIEAVAERLQPKFWEVAEADDEAKARILEQNGMTRGTVSDDMYQRVVKKTEYITQDYIARVPEAASIIKAYREDLTN